jgi:hypothetical protein
MDGWLRYPCQIDWLVLLWRHFSVPGRQADGEEIVLLLRECGLFRGTEELRSRR